MLSKNRTPQTHSSGGSVAIVAWQSKPAVFPQNATGVGGLETAAWTFAKGLAARTSWSPKLVFRSTSPLSKTQVEGVQLHAEVDRWETIRRNVSDCVDVSNRRLTRFSAKLFWQIPLLGLSWPFRQRDPVLMQPDPRLTSLHPDVWVAMGVGKETAGVVATAASQGRPSVVMLRSGADLDEKYARQELSYSDYGERSDVCRFALENANYIVCQTEFQLSRLRTLFGREGKLIRNPIAIERWKTQSSDSSNVDVKPKHILWIGRYEQFAKRIQLAMQIIDRCPEIQFRMIVNPDDFEVEQQVRAWLPSNVELLDYVPFDQMPQQYTQAIGLLVTSSSSAEGFPNVLLQAAASGTPIVSLEDFDDFIKKSSAGWVCDGNLDRAAEQLKQIPFENNSDRHRQTDQFLVEHHALDRVTDQLANLLTQITSRPN